MPFVSRCVISKGKVTSPSADMWIGGGSYIIAPRPPTPKAEREQNPAWRAFLLSTRAFGPRNLMKSSPTVLSSIQEPRRSTLRRETAPMAHRGGSGDWPLRRALRSGMVAGPALMESPATSRIRPLLDHSDKALFAPFERTQVVGKNKSQVRYCS